MNFLTQSFHTILYQPLLNALVFIYSLIGDLGVAIVILTLLVKIILFPLSLKGLRSQRAMKAIEPKVKDLKQKYKNDIANQNKALIELYKQEGISPAAGCLPLLLQLPIIIALYQVFIKGLSGDILQSGLYNFIANPGAIKESIFWIFDKNSSVFIVVLAVLAAAAQFWQSKKMSIANNVAKNKGGPARDASRNIAGGLDFGGAMQKQMLYVFPVITFFIIYKTGVVVGVYWFFSVIFSLIEQMVADRIKGDRVALKN